MSKKIPHVPRWLSMINAFRIVRNPLPVMADFLEKKGDTFSMYMGGTKKAIFTTDPEIIQHVLQKNNRNYRKSEIQTKMIGQFVGKGLLTSNGSYWLRQRRLIQPGFHRAKLAALTDVMYEAVQESIPELNDLATSSQVFDMAEEMTKMAFRVVAKSLFTTSVSEKDLFTLNNSVQKLQEYIVKRIRQPYLTPWFYLSGKHQQQFKIAQEAKDIILKIIQERRTSGNSYDDLLDMLLGARYEDTNEGMTDQQLLDETLILFVAGHETTANALAWTFYLLSENPDSVQKIRAEYKEVVGNRKIEFTDFPKLKYTTQVIQESMRIYPPAWITDRVANESDEIKGFSIGKDEMVISYIYGVHHSKKYWTHPEKFKPERFEKENMKGKPSFAYIPFGGGPRLCIGNNFSMMEMQMVVVELIKRYDFTVVKNQNIEAMPYITLKPKYGIKMSVRYGGR